LDWIVFDDDDPLMIVCLMGLEWMGGWKEWIKLHLTVDEKD